MKGAGSSWKFLKLFSILPWNKNILLIICSFIILIHNNSALRENSCSDENNQVFDKNILDDSRLVEELVEASRTRTEMSSDMSGLLQPYDATPFWYNLVQAIAMASGINPDTQNAMHQIATTSFSSSSLNHSIRKVLSYIKCGENKSSDDIIELSDIALNDDESETYDQEEVVTGPVRWTPSGKSLAENWNRETEVDINSLQDPSGINGRLRRAVRNDNNRNMADFHQPFFMSEAGPSSLVTRDPALISVSGCPSGHVKDLTGSCRQIFQYTVNFGVGNNRLDSEPARPRSLLGGSNGRPPWFFGRRAARRPTGTLRDIARDSSLFRHSVMRGYVPPFSFPRRRPLQRPEAEKEKKKPEPMEIKSPEPQIIIRDTPTVPDVTPVPSKGDDSNNSNAKNGGSSSESKDSPSNSNNDNNKNSNNNDDDD